MNVPNSKKFVNSVSRRKTKYKRNTNPNPISHLSLVQIHVQYHSLLFGGVGIWPRHWSLEPHGGRATSKQMSPVSCNLTSRKSMTKNKMEKFQNERKGFIYYCLMSKR